MYSIVKQFSKKQDWAF